MDPGYHQPNYGKVMALDGVVITGGKAARGAGIGASGIFTLEIHNSQVVGNNATKIDKSGTAGAGLFTSPGFISASLPRGGSFGPTVAITNSLFQGNATPMDDHELEPTPGIGGAMYLSAGTALVMGQATISENAAENGAAGSGKPSVHGA